MLYLGSQPKYPAQIVFELNKRRLVFKNIGGGRYLAELDGIERSIKIIRRERRAYFEEIEQTEIIGQTASIDTVLRCLELDANPTKYSRGIELSATIQWGHFRQNTFLEIAITVNTMRSRFTKIF